MSRFVWTTMAIAALVCGALWDAHPARADSCNSGSFDSTFALIQQAIFENHGCTSSVCHGAAASGGLDLRKEVAYESLVDVPSQSVPGTIRVVAGQRKTSLLWQNLAAKTFPDEFTAPLRPMPLDPLPALSADEVEAIRLWIEGGAPKAGVVRGTAELLDACLPPPQPIEIKPLPPPPPGTGVQIRMARWVLPAHSENEVCFASYYDVTDQVPPALRTPDNTFRFKRHTTRQDPLSHHLVPILYQGKGSITDPVWGTFRCRAGARDLQLCDPLDVGFCGADGICATDPERSVACIGFGPGDGGIGLSTAGISITQETSATFDLAPGVYDELPLQGIILWSSHAFNLTDEPGKLEAWLNFDFAAPEEQLAPVEKVFDADAVFRMNAPAFGTDEPCALHTFDRNTHLFELTAHTHKRGKRFRVFRGAFSCASGSHAGAACSPLGYDYASPDVCDGAPCRSLAWPRAGDCDLDGEVTIDELLTGINIALEAALLQTCPDADRNDDGAVSIDEILTGVQVALTGVPAPAERDPQQSLLYLNTIYNDPVVRRMNPPMVFAHPRATERAFTFCALYDNGFTNPSEVKTRAASPAPPASTLPVGGPCSIPTNCTAGKIGALCNGSTEQLRNQSCDSSPGAFDGFCDACPLTGGVTTEDEMFILLGQYYVP